jgi:hypothetical protein
MFVDLGDGGVGSSEVDTDSAVAHGAQSSVLYSVGAIWSRTKDDCAVPPHMALVFHSIEMEGTTWDV